jgi:hypothetical protein
VIHGSFFDGFGGLRRGLEDAGLTTTWKRDIIYGHDITRDDPDELERVDLISGGPVCRNTSRAALWQGQKTNESLWPYMLRALRSTEWVLVEQPASVDRQVILGWVKDLERCGYGVAGRIIDSKHWVPQRAPVGISSEEWDGMGWPFGIVYTLTASEWKGRTYKGARSCDSMGTVPTVCQAEYLQGFRPGSLHSWALAMELRSR